MSDPAANREPDPHFATLQAARAIAALGVLIYHAGGAAARYGGPMPWRWLTHLGSAGVDLFFVLSGFVILNVAHGGRHSGAGMDWRAFAWARFRRIYLPYWPLGLASAVVLFGFSAPQAGSWRNWLASTLLIPIGEPALNVAWTLQHEVVFYGFVALALLTGWWRAGLVLWIIAIPVGRLVGFAPVGLQAIDAEFLMGIAAWAAWRGGKPQVMAATSAALILGALLLVLFGLEAGLPLARQMAAGALFAAALPWLVRAEQAGQIRVPRPLSFLGDASYAIYLIHVLPLLALRGPLTGTGAGFAFTLIALSGLAAGIAYHLFVERPLLAWAKARYP